MKCWKLCVFILIFIFTGVLSANAACSSTSYGAGWTCIQAKNSSNGGAGATHTNTFAGNAVAGRLISVTLVWCDNIDCTNNGTNTAAITGTAQSSCEKNSAGEQNTSFRRWVSFGCVGAVGTTIIATITGGTPFYLGMWSSEWIGNPSSSFFNSSSGVGSGTGTSSTVSMTIAGTSDLFVCATNNLSIGAITPGTGFAEISEDATGEQAEAKTGVSGSQSGTSSWTGSSPWSSNCADYRPAAKSQSGVFLIGP